MAVWTGEQVAEHVGKEAPIKINPCGVDVGVSEVWKIADSSKVTIHKERREITPGKELVKPDGEYYILNRGAYELRIANRISIPINATALLFPRSTFNRLGIISSESGVGDSGYSGFCTRTIFVAVSEVRVHKDEMWSQLVFISNKDLPKVLYNGHWQNEGKAASHSE